MHAFTNGRHAYRGRLNSSGQRKASKIYKGIKCKKGKLQEAFKKLEKEKTYDRQG